MASIKLKHTSGNGTILNSPAANPSSDITLKLPSTTGSAGQVLKVASANHSSTNAELEFAAGSKVLKIKTVVKTNTYTNGAAGTHDVTGLSLTMDAPASVDSKYLVIAMLTGTTQNGHSNRFVLNGTTTGTLLQGDAAGSRARGMAGELFQNSSNQAMTQTLVVLDDPDTTATQTYKVQVVVRSGTGVYVNRSVSDGDATNILRSTSTLTVMEIEN